MFQASGYEQQGIDMTRDCKMETPVTTEECRRLIKERGIDFLDFGCSRGASIKWGRKMFGGHRGLGIDVSEPKVRAAAAAGHDAILFDINNLPPETLVRFTLMVHFLEHVRGIQETRDFVQRACEISKEFVFIRQPYFDADGYLFQSGLKLFWSDWTGHPNQMTTLQFYRLMKNLQSRGLLNRFSIHAKGPIGSSDHEAIHPVGSPVNSHRYDPSRHPAKPHGVKFRFPVYKETVVVATKNDTVHANIVNRYAVDETVVDEFGNFSSGFTDRN